MITLMLSCQSTHTSNVLVDVQAMPPEPQWAEFTRPPIIDKKDNNFTVSDEFVQRSLQMKKHLERIKTWKEQNQVP